MSSWCANFTKSRNYNRFIYRIVLEKTVYLLTMKPLQCYLCVVQEVVDAVLAIKKEGEPIDLHMVEVMEMQHKTDMDTVYTPSLYHFMLHSYASE